MVAQNRPLSPSRHILSKSTLEANYLSLSDPQARTGEASKAGALREAPLRKNPDGIVIKSSHVRSSEDQKVPSWVSGLGWAKG